jgi:hypothetical protein
VYLVAQFWEKGLGDEGDLQKWDDPDLILSNNSQFIFLSFDTRRFNKLTEAMVLDYTTQDRNPYNSY